MARSNPTSYRGKPVYIVDGSRTPFLKARGRPGPFAAADLAVAAGRPLLARQPFSAEDFDEVILGCMIPSADEANIARVAALRLGCGKNVPAQTVQRNCASGMQALDTAAMNICSGRSNLVLAGGTESMSHSPLLYSRPMVHWFSAFMGARSAGAKAKAMLGFRPSYLKPVISLLRGLRDPVVGLSMGQTAERIAWRFGIDREQMDAYAVRSHQRLSEAQQNGHIEELEALFSADGKVFENDDGVRADSSVEKLAKLRPVFDKPDGMVTAGNSAQVTDGASWLILASEKALKDHDLTPIGLLKDNQWAGLEPEEMGLGPVFASSPILKRNKLKLDAIDSWEINEAFAAQVLGCQAAWRDSKYCREHLHTRSAMGEIDPERLNVDGGGVSLGHPVGASGARIVLHLLHVLRRNNSTQGTQQGIATLCIGGGQGGAMLVESI